MDTFTYPEVRTKREIIRQGEVILLCTLSEILIWWYWIKDLNEQGQGYLTLTIFLKVCKKLAAVKMVLMNGSIYLD
jgi:hypothetical protein